MERSEKALVPEWLKGANGGATGGGGSTPHHSASSLQSDDHAIALPTRSRSSSVSSCDHDTPHSVFVERTSSAYFRRSSSSNGDIMRDKDPSAHSRSYSSFSRSHRERGWEKELDLWLGDHDLSDSLTLTSRIEKDTLRRSQSMISGKRGELLSRRAGNDTNNGLLVGGSIMSNIHKAAFERDFPSLGTEEKQGAPDNCRVSSPGLSSASQSLSIGTSAVIGGESWTSALVELPVTVGSNSTLSSVQQAAPASLVCTIPSTTTGLNMAETLAQTPARGRTTPQFTVETQRLEELAIKQSRQLIPMTPSMPKTSALNSTEKPKSKTVRSSELSTVTKVGQQPSSSKLVNQTVLGTIRCDVSKPSQAGKLTVLKATREMNDVSPTAKDGLSPTNASRVWPGVIQSAASAPLRSPVNPKLATDSKVAAFPGTHNSVDKRPPSQAQNRIDFFNSLRKKTSENHTAAVPDSIPAVSSTSEKSIDQITAIAASVGEGKDVPASDLDLEWSTGNESDVAGNGDACEGSEIFIGDEEKDLCTDAAFLPDEKEVEFLRSMGWEENAGEEAAPLTEEEINAFYELLKSRQSSRLPQGMQQYESHVGSLGGASSALSSSDSESEA